MNVFGDIIKYEILVEYEPEIIIVERATFNRDFGPWKRFEVASVIKITFYDCLIQEYTLKGILVK